MPKQSPNRAYMEIASLRNARNDTKTFMLKICENNFACSAACAFKFMIMKNQVKFTDSVALGINHDLFF